MNHKLEIKHLGPIDECALTIDNINVFTGPQSNGKSTIAKAVYFFRTIKQDILNIMMQGGPRSVDKKNRDTWEVVLKAWMRDKFLQLFGTSWVMPEDMKIKYTYKQDVYIEVYLNTVDDYSKNYVSVFFSRAIEDFLSDLDEYTFFDMGSGQKEHHEQALVKLFNDPYETVFIPAGRNLITLLSSQLNYIFTSLEGVPLRNIDYITRKYTELILKIKPLFGDGIDGLREKYSSSLDPTILKKYKNNQATINQAIRDARVILNAKYQYVDGDERLYLDEKKYIKINYSSSGQQEIVWVLNLLIYYLLEGKRVFLILEEPESHLYPETQRLVGELLSLFLNNSNSGLITTHSPYLLGTLNYLLLASQVPSSCEGSIKAVVHKKKWIDTKNLAAYFIHDGKMDDAVVSEEGITLIANDVIEGASTHINDNTDRILTCLYAEEDAND